jgi:hypothetical protein
LSRITFCITGPVATSLGGIGGACFMRCAACRTISILGVSGGSPSAIAMRMREAVGMLSTRKPFG